MYSSETCQPFACRYAPLQRQARLLLPMPLSQQVHPAGLRRLAAFAQPLRGCGDRCPFASLGLSLAVPCNKCSKRFLENQAGSLDCSKKNDTVTVVKKTLQLKGASHERTRRKRTGDFRNSETHPEGQSLACPCD